MKLSRKGLNKIHCSYVRECSPDLNQVEFEQSDFEGAVVLTKQEADRVIEALLDAERQIENDDTSCELNALVRLLGDRYKQAEGKE